jgi:hypothetical protein
VLEEKYLLMYKTENHLTPFMALQLESIHTHIMGSGEALAEVGREFSLLLSTAHKTLILAFPNSEVCHSWGKRMHMLHIMAQTHLISEARHLLLKHTVDGVTSPITVEKYVHFRDNIDQRKWGRRFLRLSGLKLEIYQDGGRLGRKLIESIRLTCLSVHKNPATMSKNAKKLHGSSALPSNHLLHVTVREVATDRKTIKENRKLYICTETEAEKKEFEMAFRIVGRGGLPPLAGCAIEALIIRPIVVEEPHKHVQYQIQVTTRIDGTEKEDGSAGNRRRDSSPVTRSWLVTRRVTAFRNLSQALHNHIPDIVAGLPELPTRTFQRNFDIKHLQERKQILQTFLQKSLSHRTIQNSGDFQQFLISSDDQVGHFLTNELTTSLGRMPIKSLNNMKRSLRNLLAEDSPPKVEPMPTFFEDVADASSAGKKEGRKGCTAF